MPLGILLPPTLLVLVQIGVQCAGQSGGQVTQQQECSSTFLISQQQSLMVRRDGADINLPEMRQYRSDSHRRNQVDREHGGALLQQREVVRPGRRGYLPWVPLGWQAKRLGGESQGFNMTNSEIDRRLALAIGYAPEDVQSGEGGVFVRFDGYLRRFDHQACRTIYPIAEKYRMMPSWFPMSQTWGIYIPGCKSMESPCPRICIALAIIKTSERGLL
jgi:hypothetical protein